jgi:hypothetical protein
VSRQPWNTGDHRRKFLCSDGRYVDNGSVCRSGRLVFWGEWEPPSNIIDKWQKDAPLPRFLHEPVWQRPTFSGPRQNTDPWVFGNCFRYSNCKQQSQLALRQLAPGSLILFGSTLDSKFVIDTLFVVRDSSPFVANGSPPETDDAFRVCTIDSLGMDTKASGKRFILYRGATLEAPVNGLYSFVPCRLADHARARFSRPIVSLTDYINPRRWRGPSGANEPRSIPELCDLWRRIRQQVLDADCLLGVSFEIPRLDDFASVT